jgi:hypothetical protein
MTPDERFHAIIDAIAARIPEVTRGVHEGYAAGMLGDVPVFVFDGDAARFRLSDDADPDAWHVIENDLAAQWVDHAWKAITHARG